MQLHAGQLVEWCMSASRDGIVERCIEGDDTDAVMLRVQLACRCPCRLDDGLVDASCRTCTSRARSLAWRLRIAVEIDRRDRRDRDKDTGGWEERNLELAK